MKKECTENGRLVREDFNQETFCSDGKEVEVYGYLLAQMQTPRKTRIDKVGRWRYTNPDIYKSESQILRCWLNKYITGYYTVGIP